MHELGRGGRSSHMGQGPRLQLDTTAINKAKPADADLAEFGLMRKAKDAWFET